MWEIRQRVRELMTESGYTIASLSAEISDRYGYKVWQTEMSKYLSGKLDTPKARKTLTDALEILSKEKGRRDALLNQT